MDRKNIDSISEEETLIVRSSERNPQIQDLSNTMNSKSSNSIVDKLIENGWVDTFRMFNQNGENYTWWDQFTRARDRNVGWRIDYFFVDEVLKDQVKSAFIMPEILGSDHCPVGIELEV